jgi:Mg2+ and Co2+ transporter CorA
MNSEGMPKDDKPSPGWFFIGMLVIILTLVTMLYLFKPPIP